MACGGDREFEIGTDEYFDFLCSVCKIKKKKTEGKYLCLDCHDYYCFNCVKCHEEIPFLKEHKVVGTEIIKPGSNIKFQALPEHDNETLANSSGDTVPQTEPDVSLSEFVEVNDVIVIKKANYERMQKESRETTEQIEQILAGNQLEIERRETTDQMEQILAGNQLEIERRETTDQMEQILAGNQLEIERRETTDQMEQILAGNQLEIERRETTDQMEQILTGNQFEIERQKQLKRELSIDRDRNVEALNMLKNKDQFSKQTESLQIKLNQQESLIDHLRRNVDYLSTELEDNRLNLDMQTACREKRQQENVTLNESIATLTSDLAAANEKIASLREELNAKKADVKKLPTEKDELSDRNDELAEEADLINQDYLEREREMRRESGEEYKALYIEKSKVEHLATKLKKEQEKNKPLLKKANEELLEKEAEIARLRKRIRDIPNDWDLKVRALKKCVTEKEMIIEELNKKLRECTYGNKKENKWTWNAPMQSPGVPVVYSAPDKQVRTAVGSFSEASARPPVMENKWTWNVPMQSPGVPVVYSAPYKQVRTAVGSFSEASARPPVVTGLCSPHVYPHPAIKSQSSSLRPLTKISGQDQIKRDYTVYKCDDSNKPLVKLLVAGVPQEVGVSIPQPEKSASCHVIDFCGPENDRFYDAEGSAIKLCSECNKTFPADVEEEVFLEHQMSHFGTLCPVCKMFKPENMADDDFEKHVNKHYADEDRAGIN